jgi:hypothetical protein
VDHCADGHEAEAKIRDYQHPEGARVQCLNGFETF